MRKYAAMGPARSRKDFVLSLGPRTKKRAISDITSQNAFQARRIDKVLEKRGQASVGTLCDETGYSLDRILDHVNYLINDVKNAKLTIAPRTSVVGSSGNSRSREKKGRADQHVTKVWKIAPGEGAEDWKLFQEYGCIGIGWRLRDYRHL